MNNDNDVKILGCIGAIAFLPFLAAYLMILKGFTLMVLWGWFIVPYFRAAPLTIPIAIGLGLVISVFTYQHSEADQQAINERDRGLAETLGAALLRPTLTYGLMLLFGWIVARFFLL